MKGRRLGRRSRTRRHRDYGGRAEPADDHAHTEVSHSVPTRVIIRPVDLKVIAIGYTSQTAS
jgi:hypothetical protein